MGSIVSRASSPTAATIRASASAPWVVPSRSPSPEPTPAVANPAAPAALTGGGASTDPAAPIRAANPTAASAPPSPAPIVQVPAVPVAEAAAWAAGAELSARGVKRGSDEGDDVIFVCAQPKRARTDAGDEVTFLGCRGAKRGAEEDDDAVFLGSQPVGEARLSKRAKVETDSTPTPSPPTSPSLVPTRGTKRAFEEGFAAALANHDAKRRRRTTPSADNDEATTLPGLMQLATQPVSSAAASQAVVLAPRARDSPTTFLDLPRELREMIYGNLLVAEKAVVPRVPLRPQAYRVGFPMRKVSSLLRANKAVHDDALGFLLRNNTFRLTIRHHRAWLNQIGNRASAQLHRIIVECDGKKRHALDGLEAFQNTLKKKTSPESLRELTYQFFWAMDGHVAIKQSLCRPEVWSSWKVLKGLRVIAIETKDRAVGFDNRLDLERRERSLSRVCLQSGGKTVEGRWLRPWRRDKMSLPWCHVTLKEGWEKYTTKDKMGVAQPEDWDNVVEIAIIGATSPHGSDHRGGRRPVHDLTV